MRENKPLAVRSGFTLAEVLIAAAIFAISTSALLYFLHASVLSFFRTADERAALARCERALALLTSPLMNCGYGLPADASRFKNSFGSHVYAPFNWPGPFSIADDINRKGKAVYKNAMARIVYAMPSGKRNMLETDSSVAGVFNLSLTAAPANVQPYTNILRTTPKNWVVFGALSPDAAPLLVSYASGSNIAVRTAVAPPKSTDLPSIPKNDELFSLHTIEVCVRVFEGNMTLMTNDYRGSGLQPRVRGIVDIRFAFDSERGLVVVYILARGNRRHDDVMSPGVPKGWPSAYDADISEEDRHYVLRASKSSWRLMNW